MCRSPRTAWPRPASSPGAWTWHRTRAGTTAMRPSTSRSRETASCGGSPSRGSTPAGPPGGRGAGGAARGGPLPSVINPPRTRDDWVFTVDDSPWLAERHHYEMQRYSTPLAETHQHYVFQFHDEFAEAIAEGIWLDIADPARPYARPARHPLAELDPGLPRDRFRSASGIEWELRHAAGSDAELISDSRLCSQRLYQLDLILDGRSREGASIWLRTRNGRTVSQFARPWPGGELARHEGVARPEDFEDPWEAYLASVAQRRREMGR